MLLFFMHGYEYVQMNCQKSLPNKCFKKKSCKNVYEYIRVYTCM